MTVEEYDIKEWNNLFYQGYANQRTAFGRYQLHCILESTFN